MTGLEKKLAQYSIPEYDQSALQKTIKQSKQAFECSAPQDAVTNKQFILTQVRFIRKRMWALQLAFLLGMYLIVTALLREGFMVKQIFPLLSIATPLLILINVTDFVRFYNAGMLEIEMATRFSLQKVATAKLIIFGLSDVLLLFAVATFAAASTQTHLLTMLLYCLVPFNCMCFGCMVLLQKVSVDHFSIAAVILAAGLATIVDVMDTRSILYTAAFNGLWLTTFLITCVAVGWQLTRWLKKLTLADELLS